MKSRGVGTAGATGALAPRNFETTGARVSFRPRNIFPHFWMLFLKLPLFVVTLPTYNYKKLSYRRVTARCVLSVVILLITTHQCRN